MLLNLSRRFTDKADLMTLGIKRFGMESFEVYACIDQNRNSTTEAAHDLLVKWRENILDDQEAYEKLCKVLDDIHMPYFKNALNTPN